MAEGLGFNAVVPIGELAPAWVVWRAAGRLRVTIIAKVTFAFVQDAEMTLAPPQPIHRGDQHHGADAGRSVRAASDLVPYMPRADVLFTGAAYAPKGQTVRALTARIGLFDGQP